MGLGKSRDVVEGVAGRERGQTGAGGGGVE